MNNIKLIYLDSKGKLIEDPDYTAIGLNGIQVEIADDSWVDLPAGAEVLALPGRLPMGYDEDNAEVNVIEEMTAVAAILPMGFTRTLTPGYEIKDGQELPLFGYTAVGSSNGKLKVAAVKTDEELKWNPVYYNTADLPRLVAEGKSKFAGNRIVTQLGRCALEYHCLTAQNIFYGRWEAGIPVSPRCNANCLGCISLQPAECCPSPQSRIDFVPTVDEVVEIAVHHLKTADSAIISFGQGCEGEPSLQKDLLRDSIREIRKQTDRGSININTNAGYFDSIRELVDAGLDSIRVSLFSAVPEHYNWYHRPCGYSLSDVRKSLKYASDHGLMVAINLLLFPGFTNQSRETAALYDIITNTGINQVQLRNLNLDPEKLSEVMLGDELPDIQSWLGQLHAKFPDLAIGNYTIPRR